MAKIVCDYCGKEFERRVFCKTSHKSNFYHHLDKELEKPKENLEKATGVVPKRIPSRCELDKFNGRYCKFPAKYEVRIRNWEEGKVKEGYLCGKHRLALKTEQEGGGYDILLDEVL